MGMMDKVKRLASQAREKTGPLAKQAKETTAKGVDAAASGVDKATGGRFHDRIEGVSNKVDQALDRDAGKGPEKPKGSKDPKNAKDIKRDAADKDDKSGGGTGA